MRKLVTDGYDKGTYDQRYDRQSIRLECFEKCMCEELLSLAVSSPKLLDLGCGVGLPYDGFFVKKGAKLTGVDISKRHVALARKNVPQAKFLLGDFFNKSIKGRFDVITSFYAIFHIPRAEHAKLLKHIHALLKKDGHILITLGARSMKMAVSKDFVGAPMAWSSYSVEKNKKLVRDAGFEIILSIEDHRREDHLWILARKKGTRS